MFAVEAAQANPVLFVMVCPVPLKKWMPNSGLLSKKPDISDEIPEKSNERKQAVQGPVKDFNSQNDSFSISNNPLHNPSEVQPRGLFFIISHYPF